jgi:hypothetical protein
MRALASIQSPASGGTSADSDSILDGVEIVGARDDPLGDQKSRGEVHVAARRPHDYGERLALDTYLEGLLRGRQISRRRAPLAVDADDIHLGELMHRQILMERGCFI